MKRSDRKSRHYFDDILLAINRIFEYTENYQFVDFKRDYKTNNIKNLIRSKRLIISVAKITQNFCKGNPNKQDEFSYAKILKKLNAPTYLSNYIPNK